VYWYEPDVQALERARAVQPPAPHPSVFYGSSSIRLWDTLAEDVDPSVLNLGFGGSTLEACDHFFARLVLPVQPRSLLVYAGDNDLGDGRSVDHVVSSFRSLLAKVDASLGPIPFGFLSIKPSPARQALTDRIAATNALIERDILAHPTAYFINVFPAMLDSAGHPRRDLYVADGLHLSREGYRLWARLLEPYRNQILATPTLA